MIFNSSFMIGAGRPTAEIPIGGIVGWYNNTPPTGWSMFTDGHLRAFRVAGSIATHGANGGTGQMNISGETNYTGGHIGTPNSFNAIGGDASSGTGHVRFGLNNRAAGDHNHTFSANDAYTPPTLRSPHIVKTSSPGELPAGASIHSLAKITKPNWDFISDYVGRVLANTTAGAISTVGTNPTTRGITTSNSPGHRHGSNAISDGNGTSNFGPDSYGNDAAGAHNHYVTVAISAINLQRVNVARYTVAATGRVPVGVVIGYIGDTNSLPAGWYVADGTNGTVDLSDCFLMLSSEDAAGMVEGDGSVSASVSSVTSAGAHSHRGVNFGHRAGYLTSHSDTDGEHSHTASLSVTVDPSYRGLVFIQYKG